MIIIIIVKLVKVELTINNQCCQYTVLSQRTEGWTEEDVEMHITITFDIISSWSAAWHRQVEQQYLHRDETCIDFICQ